MKKGETHAKRMQVSPFSVEQSLVVLPLDFAQVDAASVAFI